MSIYNHVWPHEIYPEVIMEVLYSDTLVPTALVTATLVITFKKRYYSKKQIFFIHDELQ